MSETQAATETNAGVADDIGITKRSIQMRQFKGKTAIQRCVKDQVAVALGQIVGHVYEIAVKQGRLPNGEMKESLFAIGDFEGVVYDGGEVLEAHGAYLPGYFAEVLAAALKRPGASVDGIVFGIEVVAMPTGIDDKTGLPRPIPFEYNIRNLAAKQPDSPMANMKRQLQAGNRLRLPPPPARVAAEPLALTGGVSGAVSGGVPEEATVEGEPAEPAADPGDEARAADIAAARRGRKAA